MSDRREPYGKTDYTLVENQSLVIHDCPPERIENQLERAGFIGGNRIYKKSHTGFSGDDAENDDGHLVVTARRIGDDELRLSAESRVGIVQVLPGSQLRIEPKIGWEPILEMILRIQRMGRSRQFYGVPLDEFLGDEVGVTEILFILTINYLNGIETIRERGFIRDLNLVYEKGFDRSGEVAVEQTVEATAQGDPTPQWRQMRSDYDNTANSLLHFAGKRLLRVFQQETDRENHPAYDRLFADLYEQAGRLEELGVTSGVKRLNAYHRFDLDQLPRQRHYYQQAVQIARAVLRSTLSKEFGSAQELTVDYLLNMNTLFQDYSQTLLEDFLREFRQLDPTGALDGVQVGAETPLRPFQDDAQHVHQPDHLVYRDDPTNALAVLDSKYYQEGSNPAMESPSRSRILTYAYLTGCDDLAFLCPLLRPSSHMIVQTEANLRIVAPDRGSDEPEEPRASAFTIGAYRESVRSYLEDIVLGRYPELRIVRELTEPDDASSHSPILCLSGVDTSGLSAMLDVDGPFGIRNSEEFADRVRKAAVQSPHTPTRRNWKTGGKHLKRTVQDTCESSAFPDHRTTCVPVLYPAEPRSDGTVQLYFVIQDVPTDEGEGPPRRSIVDKHVLNLR